MSAVNLSHTTHTYPSLPYQAIKDAILKQDYELSLVFLGSKRAQQLNQSSRQKNYVPNVLSFPLTNTAGEIYICLPVAKAEANKFGATYPKHVGFLYIHGLLHLKGHDHGPRMENLERKYCHQFSFL